MDYRKLLTFRWIFTTLLVLVAVGVMVKLGLWQLDRLAERRAENARVAAQVNAPALDLNEAAPAQSLESMEYRRVVVRGTYDPQNEILLRNQAYENQPGYHLLTPLRISGSDQAVLVNRGFIPLDQAKALAQYAQPGEVTVTGVLREPFVPRMFGVPDPTLAPGQQRLDTWNYANLPRIQEQVDYPLLPMLVQVAPSGEAGDKYPVGSLVQPDLSEGSHLGYAVQWFSFAAILALGYPFFVKKQLETRPNKKGTARSAAHSAALLQIEGGKHENSGNR